MPSAQALKSTLLSRHMIPSLNQADQLQRRLGELDATPVVARLGIVHTYTSELLEPWLQFAATLNGLTLETYHAPYGVTLQEATSTSGLARHQPDITLLMLRKEDLHPALSLPISTIPAAERGEIAGEFCSALVSLVTRFRNAITGQIVISLLPDLNAPGLGLYDSMAGQSEMRWWNELKGAIADAMREHINGVTLLDMEQLMLDSGRRHFFDHRLWYASTFPFSPEGCFRFALACSDIAASLYPPRAKVIALDADNTLWGGVLGEDGVDGIELGPEYPGRAFIDFQKRLISYQQRGFLLVLCSKNNPQDVDEVLREHPHQLLRHEHFVAERVNWLPKTDNLKSLAGELNLGLDAFIFVDDSDHECAAVRHSLPEVEVVQVPSRANEIPFCLDSLARLEITSLTAEDLEKTAMYAREKRRKSRLAELTAEGGSVDDYLLSLEMCMTVRVDSASHLPRLAQLTQKTNQFNLTTRRYTEQDIARMIDDPGTSVYQFSLADTFGDSGVVGLAIITRDNQGRADIDSFLMSCRVIGRSAELAFLSRIIDCLEAEGVETLTARYIPTRKNAPVANFLDDAGFETMENGDHRLELEKRGDGPLRDLPITIEGP